MPDYAVNEAGVAHARELIDAGEYDDTTEWSEAAPSAAEENEERASCPSRQQRDLAEELAQAGADVLVGTHAHALQGAGWLGDTYVAYGLGNFVWWRSNSEVSVETGVLDLTVDDGGVRRADFVPARIDDAGIPQLRLGPDAEQAEADFAALRACAGLSDSPS